MLQLGGGHIPLPLPNGGPCQGLTRDLLEDRLAHEPLESLGIKARPVNGDRVLQESGQKSPPKEIKLGGQRIGLPLPPQTSLFPHLLHPKTGAATSASYPVVNQGFPGVLQLLHKPGEIGGGGESRL